MHGIPKLYNEEVWPPWKADEQVTRCAIAPEDMYWLSSVAVQMPQAIMPHAIKCKRLFTIAKISMAWRPRKGIYGQRFASAHTARLPTTGTYDVESCILAQCVQVCN